MSVPTLYHFTCNDGRVLIGDQGVLKPHWHPLVGASLIWLTDDPEIERDAAGLTSASLSCDRMANRYVVADPEVFIKVRPWLGSIQQARTSPHVQADLHRYSEPAKWWISSAPLFVRLDEQA